MPPPEVPVEGETVREVSEGLVVAEMARTVTHVYGVLPAAFRQWLVPHVGRQGRGLEASDKRY